MERYEFLFDTIRYHHSCCRGLFSVPSDKLVYRIFSTCIFFMYKLHDKQQHSFGNHLIAVFKKARSERYVHDASECI